MVGSDFVEDFLNSIKFLPVFPLDSKKKNKFWILGGLLFCPAFGVRSTQTLVGIYNIEILLLANYS